MEKPDEFSQTTALGEIAGSVMRYAIATPSSLNVPYEGSDPAVQAAFPHGFPPSFGSGLAFKGEAGDGARDFYCLTDRGPNGDGPLVALGDDDTRESKLFPAPSFVPSIGVVRVDRRGARLIASMPILSEQGVPASGLPRPPGSSGHSDELPLPDSLRLDLAGKVGFRDGGIDTEAIAFDPVANVLWVSDEYGPFLLKIDPSSGRTLQRYGPGDGLPSVLSLRRANRGMEGMTVDPESGLVHAFLQSPLSDGKAPYHLSGHAEKVERYAGFLRWIVFDPASAGTRASYAYPLAHADYAKGRTGNAKLGDVVALGKGRFVVIEQGEGANGAMFNHLMLVDTAGASDITPWGSALERSSMAGMAVEGADWRAVTPMRKTLLLDLNRIGWTADKAEGLALADPCTLAISNDNDFGMRTRMSDKHGNDLPDADVTTVTINPDGAIVHGAARDDAIGVAALPLQARTRSLWLLHFARPLASL